MKAAAVSLPLAAILLIIAINTNIQINATYIESVAANVDTSIVNPHDKKNNRQHKSFVPMVAFQCGYKSKFIDEKDGEWHDDINSGASCLQEKYAILKYCQKVYPTKDITNIVEYSHLSHIEKWCKEDTGNCKHESIVRPYRCIVGEFVTESLQVPSRCRFSHIAGKNKCNDYKYWNLRAESECGLKVEEETKKSMKLRSFSILEPCGLGMFRGVEYVCCPKSVEDKFEKVIDLEKDEDDDDYDEDEDDDEEKDTKKSEKNKESKEQDSYFKEDTNSNEHERFHDAVERLEKKYRKKVTKVIAEWSELFERYNKMKEKDPKGAEEYKREMTARFRKTVNSIEEENKEQRIQIEDVHDERVQAILNEKKREATHDYRAALALQVGSSNKNNILRTLKNYIKAEEKDRTHMLNRYRHLLRVDPVSAISFEPVLLHRLRYIDLRINGTLAMLRDFPEIENSIRTSAVKFWSSYRRENTPETHELNSLQYIGDEKNNERLIRLYKQTYEQNHPGSDIQLAFSNVKAEIGETKLNKETTTISTTTIPTTTEKRDVIFEKEDSDEDQFDDDDEENSNEDSSSTSKSIIENEKVKANLLAPYRIQAEPALLKKPIKEPKKEIKTKVVDEDENVDDEEEDNEEGDMEKEKVYFELNDKKNRKNREKNLNVAIEPIVSNPLRIDEEEMNEIQPAYAKHHMLVAYNNEFGERLSVTNLFTNFNIFVIAIAAFAIVLIVVGVVFKRRSRHPGFIEVDVCTPEERHVNGMQVNGYENPTYTYFDSKA